jgi:hypothetical protein
LLALAETPRDQPGLSLRTVPYLLIVEWARMRRVILLVVVVLVLVGSGIVSVQWGDGSATISFDKEKAKERTGQLLDKAREFESEAEAKIKANAEKRSP